MEISSGPSKVSVIERCSSLTAVSTGIAWGLKLGRVRRRCTFIFMKVMRFKMADEQSGVQRSFSKIKQWIGWSWTYLWGFWFLLVIFLLYVLRTPLRLKENLNLGESLLIICLKGNKSRSSRGFSKLISEFTYIISCSLKKNKQFLEFLLIQLFF